MLSSRISWGSVGSSSWAPRILKTAGRYKRVGRCWQWPNEVKFKSNRKLPIYDVAEEVSDYLTKRHLSNERAKGWKKRGTGGLENARRDWFVSEINYTPLIWRACNSQTDGDWKQACGYHRLGEAGNKEWVMNQYGVNILGRWKSSWNGRWQWLPSNWMYMMPLNCTVDGSYNAKFCYVYFTTIKEISNPHTPKNYNRI